MADIVWTDVTDIITDLPASITGNTALHTLLLSFVNERVDGDAFDGEDGPTTRMARIYLLAHTAVMTAARGSTGAAGPVTSQSAGGLSRSYGSVDTSTTSSDLAQTPHGVMFAFLVRTSPARVPFNALACP